MPQIHDPIFAVGGPSPYPAGTAPFRQKGNGYLGDLEYLDKQVSGGREAVLAAIPTPSVRTFLRQQFRGSEWYDAFPCVDLHAAAARIRGVSFAEQRTQVGVHHAREAGGGIYRGLLRVVSNDSIALWGPRISSIYFEFGKTKTRSAGDKHVVGIRRGLPAGLAQFVLFASKGFSEETLRLAGAKTASCELGLLEPEDRAHAQQLFEAEMSIRWT